MIESTCLMIQGEQRSEIDLYHQNSGFGDEFRQLSDISEQWRLPQRFCVADHRDVEQVVRDENANVQTRLASLQHWLVASPDNVAVYVADQLDDQDDLDLEWLKTIVRAADSVVFPPDRLETVAKSLLKAASQFRDRDEFGAAEICWSAIHRAGSLLPVNCIARLLPFLENSGEVDTRLVVLQAIFSMVEVEPLLDKNFDAELYSRIEKLGRSNLEPDVFCAGETSAIGIECLMALAGLSPGRSNPLCVCVSVLNRTWLSRTIAGRYRELLASWRQVSLDSDSFGVLEDDLASLALVDE